MPTQFKWNHKSIEAWKPDREKTQIHPTSGLRLRGYPSGKKTWQWKRTRDKREFKDTLGAFPAFSLADANAWAVELNAIFDRGDDPTAKAPEPAPEVERVTVEKAWEAYLRDCERRGVRAIDKRDKAARKDIIEVIGHKPVRDVVVADIEKVIAGPCERAKTLKRANTGGVTQSNAVLRIARTLFQFCVKREIDGIQRNPALAIDMVPAHAIKGRRERYVPTFREMALLVMAAREYDRRNCGETTMADAITLMVMNGNRKSEVMEALGSEWNSSGMWTIPGDRYKTRIDHPLTVGPTSAAILERLAKGTNQFLIPAQTGVRTGHDEHVCDRLRVLMEEIGGAPVTRWTMHCIRYGFRSNIRLLGIADPDLAERIIHPKQPDISDLYEGKRRGEMTAALAKWDAAIVAEIASISRERLQAVA